MKFKYLLFCLLPLCGLVSCNSGKAGDIEFVFDTTSRKTGTSNLAFDLAPGPSAVTSPDDFRIYVDWGDGEKRTITVEDYKDAFEHSYKKPNKYKIKINGDISGFSFSKKEDDETLRLLSDDNINANNFVLNSIAKIGLADNCTVTLGGVDSTGELVSKMSEAKINYQLTYLYEDMFKDTSLKTVTLPSSLIAINKDDFAGLETLEAINLPNDNHVTIIEDGAFSGCSALKSFTVPKYVTKLGDGVFSECASLTEFVFPSTLTELGSEVFMNCKKLKTLKFEGTIPLEIARKGEPTFDGISPEKVIVPKGYVERYKTEWSGKVSSEFLSKIVEA